MIQAREGDRIVIRDDALNGVTGVVRKVYHNQSISVALDEGSMDQEQINGLTRSPYTGKLHWLVELGAYEIFNRRLIT